jgi:hypothetical protein
VHRNYAECSAAGKLCGIGLQPASRGGATAGRARDCQPRPWTTASCGWMAPTTLTIATPSISAPTASSPSTRAAGGSQNSRHSCALHSSPISKHLPDLPLHPPTALPHPACYKQIENRSLSIPTQRRDSSLRRKVVQRPPICDEDRRNRLILNKLFIATHISKSCVDATKPRPSGRHEIYSAP